VNAFGGELGNFFSVFFSAFHFLRPSCLLALPVILSLWWWLRRPAPDAQNASAHVAPHLARALSVGEPAGRGWQLRPADLAALVLTLLSVGAAGPAWTRLPDPLMAKTAPLVLVIQVSDSMQEPDVPPSRLERGKQKILDLLATRDGAPTALVAYAGSAHRVVPLAEDENLLRPYVEGLEVDIMPVPGNNAAAALKLAESILAAEQTPGGILFFSDGIEQKDLQAFNQRDGNNSLGLLILVPGNKAIAGADNIRGARVARVTPDKRDLEGFQRYFNSAFRHALVKDDNLQWNDRAWWLAWPAAILMLFWFRRGFVIGRNAMPAGSIALALAVVLTGTAQNAGAQPAGPLEKLFTPDQLGQLYSNRNDYARAAGFFDDPYRKGYAQYQAGHYEDAANTLAPLTTPEAVFTRGMAQIKSGQYEDAIAAFEQVLQSEPQFPGAEENLAQAKKILAYMQKSRGDEEEELQQSEDEDETFDPEQQPQQPVEKQGEQDTTTVSAEQWMSTLDTSTSDFLKQRFAVEAENPQTGEQ